jgi:hypothetical protein
MRLLPALRYAKTTADMPVLGPIPVLATCTALRSRCRPRSTQSIRVTRNLVSQHINGWISNAINTNRTCYLALDRAIATI